jgi:hypothetical protein
VYFARSVSGITSVGLKAVAFVKPRVQVVEEDGPPAGGASSGLMCWVKGEVDRRGVAATRAIGPPLSISQ